MGRWGDSVIDTDDFTYVLGIVSLGVVLSSREFGGEFELLLWIFCVLDLFAVFVVCGFSHFTRMRLYLVPLVVLWLLMSEDFSAVFRELGCSECFREDVCGVFG